MKIEHWHAQSATQFNHEQLDYSNLLAVCMGNEGQPPADQHCDTRKADREVSRNPARAADRVEEILQFGNDGTIRSSDPIFDSDINEILNLNFSFLKNNRKEALSALLEAIGKRGQVSNAQLERWLREWDGTDEGSDLRPHCQVVVYWLKKRLARA